MMPSQDPAAFRRALTHLRKHGLLLLSDSKLVSVTTLVVGKPVRGSWWGHPKGRDIFRVVCQVADHPDVAVTKLISGKVTFVHRKLWPALIAVGTSRESWQMNGLSRKAENLLQLVDRNGEVRSDRLPASPKAKHSPWRAAVRELEERLLVYVEEFHSEIGAHARRLESWRHWADRVGIAFVRLTPINARQDFEKVIQKLNSKYNAPLPWKED
jgi:hypothetical protein